MDPDDLFRSFTGSSKRKYEAPEAGSSAPSPPPPLPPPAASPPPSPPPLPPAYARPPSPSRLQLDRSTATYYSDRGGPAVSDEAPLPPKRPHVSSSVERRPIVDCLHDVSLPASRSHESPEAYMRPVEPQVPARSWPFPLDPFQKAAISCIERGESVLVSAHTSAGKTVVAEYAIALALRERQRVIYTTPIKALSNQKYREFYEIFADVGLMTGDVTVNSDASCLVVTTEILRSMLYRGSDLLKSLRWVVFDEVHYMRDKERGVVWEESIVQLPDSVRMLFLSATIPNAKEFSDWIARAHNQPCHVILTERRPVPLQHFVFPASGDGLHLVVDEDGGFHEENLHKAVAQLTERPKRPAGQSSNAISDTFNLVKMIVERSNNRLDPVIVFAFSKKECEALAMQVSKLDMCDETERSQIEKLFRNAVDGLSAEEKELPQIAHLLPLLRRGIAVHHAGLLPILREVTELLFQEGLIKVLFATETFSMGMNMPARTVLFTSLRKFDGTAFRWLTSGEYIQMSGRAGRRGKDARGMVILMLEERLETKTAREILLGHADPLESAFRVSYHMLLNINRVPGGDPEKLISKSFFQHQHEAAGPALSRRAAQLASEINAMAVKEDPADALSLEEYGELRAQHAELKEVLRALVMQPIHSLPFLKPGRLVQLKPASSQDNPAADSSASSYAADGSSSQQPPSSSFLLSPDSPWTDWAVVVNFQQRAGAPAAATSYVVDVLLPMRSIRRHLSGQGTLPPSLPASSSAAAASSGSSSSAMVPAGTTAVANPSTASTFIGLSSGGLLGRRLTAEEAEDWTVVPVAIGALFQLSSVVLYMPKDLRLQESRLVVARAMKELRDKFPDGAPLLDPVEDMKVDDTQLPKLMRKLELLESTLQGHALVKKHARRLPALYQRYLKRKQLERQLKDLRKQLKNTEGMVLKDELKGMRRVLRKLGHVSSEGTLLPKGRIAADLEAGDELLLTELLLNGHLAGLTAAQLAALLSCFVFQEKSGGDAKQMAEELQAPLRLLREEARKIARVMQDSGLEIDAEAYVSSFRPHLMEVVFSWAQGARFIDICKMTDVFEGTIVRTMRRLEELLTELCAACKTAPSSLPHANLEERCSEAVARIKRDIVSCDSLYV